MQQSLEEILRSRMAVPVSIKGKEGATVMSMEVIARRWGVRIRYEIEVG